EYASPRLVAEVGAYSEHAQRVVPILANAQCGLTAQDIGDMPRTIALPSFTPKTEDRREQLLCGHRTVPALRRLKASVAVPARRNLLPEIGQQLLAAAVHGLTQGEHGIQLATGASLELIVPGRFIDHPALLDHVLQPVGHPCRSRLT